MLLLVFAVTLTIVLFVTLMVVLGMMPVITIGIVAGFMVCNIVSIVDIMMIMLMA